MSVEFRRSLKHTARDLRAKTLQNHKLNMSEAQDQNQGFFNGNIMNFERPKFDSRRDNRLEALKAFKKKCGYILKGSLVNISNERKCIFLVKDWLSPEGQKIYDSLDWFEGEDVNGYDLMWTKLERAVSPECNETVASKKFKERVQNQESQ